MRKENRDSFFPSTLKKNKGMALLIKELYIPVGMVPTVLLLQTSFFVYWDG